MRMDPAKLRRARERKVLSMRELSRLSGVANDGIIAYERGDQEPRPSTIRKLAAALGIDPADLLAADAAAGDEGERG